MSRIRSALLITGAIELNGDMSAVHALVDTKLQILVAAQIFGERCEVDHRTGMRRLMRQFPWIHVVYNYDVVKDMKEQVQGKIGWNKSCSSSSQSTSTLQHQLSHIHDVLGPTLVTQTWRTTKHEKTEIMDQADDSAAATQTAKALTSDTTKPAAVDLHSNILMTCTTLRDSLLRMCHMLSSYTMTGRVTATDGDGDEKSVNVEKSEKSTAIVPVTTSTVQATETIKATATATVTTTATATATTRATATGTSAATATAAAKTATNQQLTSSHHEIASVCDITWRNTLHTVLHTLMTCNNEITQDMMTSEEQQMMEDAMDEIDGMMTQWEEMDAYQLALHSILTLQSHAFQLSHTFQSHLSSIHHTHERLRYQYHGLVNDMAAQSHTHYITSTSAQLQAVKHIHEMIYEMEQQMVSYMKTYQQHITEMMAHITSYVKPSSSTSPSPSYCITSADIIEFQHRVDTFFSSMTSYQDAHHTHQHIIILHATFKSYGESYIHDNHKQLMIDTILSQLEPPPTSYSDTMADIITHLSHRVIATAQQQATAMETLQKTTHGLIGWMQVHGYSRQDFENLHAAAQSTTTSPTSMNVTSIFRIVGDEMRFLLERVCTIRYVTTPTSAVATTGTGTGTDKAIDDDPKQYAPHSLVATINIIMQTIHITHHQQMTSRINYIRRITHTTQTLPTITTPAHTSCILACTNLPIGPITPSSLVQAFSSLAQYSHASALIHHSSTSSSTASLDGLLHLIPRSSPLLLGHLPHPHLDHLAGAPQTNPKSENQLHALIFATGECIQAIDMNQDLAMEEAFKIRWMTAEFQYNKKTDIPRFCLVGCSEVIYTEHVSACGRYMALQDLSFATIVQRVLNYTGVRMHYGHPDLFDGYWARFHVGLSKASAEKNLSEDLFFGFDALSRGAPSTYVEYIRFGKGREVAISTTSVFEDKLARGASHTLKSPDMYRLHRWLDPFTCLSLIMGSIGHYLYTLLFDYTITSFIWIEILMAMSGTSSERIGILGSVYAIPWLFHLGYMFGLPLLFQLIYERGLFHGSVKWARNLILGSIYYLFQLRTKAMGVQTGFHGGSAKYKGTGRSFALAPDSLLHLYQNYARSHYHHALQLLILLIVFVTIFSDEPFFYTILLKTYAIILASGSWICAPALFNPTFTYTTSADLIIRAKWIELKSVRQWIRASYTDSCESWERWWWKDHHELIRLRAVRYHMQQGVRRGCNHTITTSVMEFLFRCIEWFPWLILTYALFLHSITILPSIIGYTFLVLIIHTIIPETLHTLLLVTLIGLYYTIIHTQHLINNPGVKSLGAAWLLSWSNLLDLFSAIFAFLILFVMITDLMLYVNDGIVATQMVNKYKSRVTQTSTSTETSTSPHIDDRPPLIRWVCSSPMFAPWQLVYRYVCVYSITLFHGLIGILTSYTSNFHSQITYNISMKMMRASHVARMQEIAQN